MTTLDMARNAADERLPSVVAVRWLTLALVTTTWLSAALFGTYILAYYGGAVPRGTLADWNHTLPRLYEPATPMATIAMGAHFLTGAILLLLGPIQLLRRLRLRVPTLHRWLGRLYVASAGFAGAAGLIFIFFKGTAGGPVMSTGFAIYGALMALAAVQTYTNARKRRFDKHRRWATRLFALAVGSWLYRMEYGFWFSLTGGLGSADNFSGPFDHVMAFFFYVPNLAVAELLIDSRARDQTKVRVASATVLTAATALSLVGTYYFVRDYWGPGILAAI
jgi:uncharacterized membrane protein